MGRREATPGELTGEPHEPYIIQARGWEMYLAAERAALVRDARGGLARALSSTLPGESREELDRLVEEDRRLAQLGLVTLVASDGTAHHKQVDDLTPEDMPARRRADTLRLDWLIQRTDRALELLGVEPSRADSTLIQGNLPETVTSSPPRSRVP